MDSQIEAVARAACQADGLDPDLMIDSTDYQGGVRSTEHHRVPQWHAHVPEATKFVAMHRALATAHGTAPDAATPLTLNRSPLGGIDPLA